MSRGVFWGVLVWSVTAWSGLIVDIANGKRAVDMRRGEIRSAGKVVVGV